MSFFDKYLSKVNFKEVLETHIYNRCALSEDQEVKGDEIYAYIYSPKTPPNLELGLDVSQQRMSAKIFRQAIDDINKDFIFHLKGMFLRDLDQKYLYQIDDYRYKNDYLDCDLTFLGSYYDDQE